MLPGGVQALLPWSKGQDKRKPLKLCQGSSVGHQDGPALEGTAQGGGGVPGGVPEGLDRALSALDLVTRQASGTGWTGGFFQAK